MSARPKVLLVDDRPDNLLAMEAQLRSLEAQFLKAGSGRAALDLLLEHEVTVVILDVQMPEMDGFEVAELMRGSPRTREIPIIFVTAGLHDRARIFKGYEAGAVDFLIKPIEARVLANKVGVFLQLHQQRRALAERIEQLETAEKARRDSERHFQIMADNIGQLAWMARPDGYIFWYNRRWYEYTGTSYEQMQGWGWRSVHDPRTLPEVMQRWTSAIAAGQPFEMEFPLRGADGEFRRFLTRAFPRKGEDGRVLEWFGTNTDVTTLVETQRALQESEQRFRHLFSSMSEGFAVHELICDREGKPVDYRFLEMNPAFERLTGLGREILGRTHSQVLPDDDPKWVQIYGKVALTGEPMHFENYSPGLKCWYEVVAFSPAPGRFATLFSDISERKRSEEAIRDSERLLRDVIDGSPDLLVFLKDCEGRFIKTNSRLERLLGKSSQGEIVGKTDFDLFPEDKAEYYRAHDRQVIETGMPVVMEEEADMVDGHHVFLAAKFPLRDSSGKIYGVGAVSHDVSDRKKLEVALRAREQRFRQLAEALPQVVFETDDSGRGYFNSRWLEFTGQSPDDVAGRMEVVHPDDRERVSSAFAQAVETGRPFECEYRLRRHDGQYRWFLSRALPFQDEAGNTRRWFGTSTDIHDLKAAQEALHEADRRKTEFLAVLSHELRNPLAPIKNSLYVLDRAAPGSDQAKRAKETIGRQVEQLANLVNDLLDVTRITRNKVRLQKELFELNEIVRRTAEDNRSLFDRSQVELKIELASAPIMVNADRTRLAQIISNLLQNAAKFTCQGGLTSIRVKSAGDNAIVRVTDTGVGMAEATLQRLFQPFAQAAQSLDRSAGGLGLGLALVKGLVELHGGRITAKSEGLGKGSEFVLELPCGKGPSERATPAPVRIVRESRRILIIEDNRDAAESLREVLEFEQHEVAVAYDGFQGLQTALAFRPDVILCDIGLPGMDGYEVARALQADERLRSVHLVALSGYALPEDLNRAWEAGFHDHLAKPPSIERLIEILSRDPSRPARGGRLMLPSGARPRPGFSS